MRLDNFSKYLQKLIKDGRYWSNTDLIGNKEKKIFFLSPSTFIALVSAILIAAFMKNGFNDSFVGYVISALSIFVGLFLTLVLSVFDKFQNLPKIVRPSEEQKVNLLKRNNFFKQFTSLTSLAIFFSLVSIVLLSVNLMTDLFKDCPFNYAFCFNKNLDLIQTFVIINIWFYNSLILFFLIRFILIVLYSVSSIHSYMMIEYEPKEE